MLTVLAAFFASPWLDVILALCVASIAYCAVAEARGRTRHVDAVVRYHRAPSPAEQQARAAIAKQRTAITEQRIREAIDKVADRVTELEARELTDERLHEWMDGGVR